ncbi:bifunctional ADP-dependent NAD(P)H-hydrate dehydratase/NAD(P)H-hydrate epimerase [Actinomyces naeslundii]|uniref:bifunctional ADP-dependent NAD(P)H-hydrate dehydratase/NAD(P)H-hydrate epimerase n=1 Tax=Actinomyces naeslundii TaxID=1655 RepID=UPI00094CDA5D|nr:bifunctional ADP-dependent NAD(P)H-hydrate dehydratase/NAD(P)H-hydrate epimerase [Actinomyces naeslundii]OLO87681.1 bifunctional ADP-dependent (S)-NAD(P)H-hydrate dehydratase/NAD(P)H-hydrate epimerase [Actinomyces naeslundii]OLO90045.1 bifunctional ADP-dependent (S)-NAD(P)H-hydrate dehydratase/NAD(P)H-hydrate epimerase [Actinomyces naeslundii]OLO90514.1 bifunctional ADP-dependent (S)-NAD(P)H-hydrate dehydratase/NAD(P)H-hydrate epimerase [Actinomyces naeslundii]OMG14670.1 bifunctional ADP-dep
MGQVSDLNDFARSDDVTDPTTCAWPAQEIAAAEAPVTAGTDRYMRAAAHAVARAALRELRQGPVVPGVAASLARPSSASPSLTHLAGPPASPASPVSPAAPTGTSGEAAGTHMSPGWISGAPVLLLVGGGHNGADTLLAGGLLSHSGCAVTAVLATEHPHPVALEEARSHGVTVYGAGYRSDGAEDWDSAEAVAAVEAFLARGGLVLDGLTGIGATGPLRPDAVALIAPLVAAGAPGRRPLRVIAVDLPSGTGVDDGTVDGPVLAADCTVTFTCLKGCLCLPPARHLCGAVEVVPLGLPAPTNRPIARRPVDGALGDYLTRVVPEPGADDHKYTRGVVGLWAGSETYPGAAVLAASGAVLAGAGMVRLTAPRRVEDLVLATRPEVVPAAGRSQALVLGPGVDPADTVRADELREVLRPTLAPARDSGGGRVADGARTGEEASDGATGAVPAGAPAVVDAGALSILTELLDEGLRCTPRHVLTPHAGEAAALLTALADSGTPEETARQWNRERVEAHPAHAVREICRLSGATVLLKGATTLIAAPHHPLVSVDSGPGWMATAGSGDVLAGVLGAVLAGAAARWEREAARAATGADSAQGVLVDSVAAGVRLHALAGAYAAAMPGAGVVGAGGHPVAALDIAAALGPARLELNWLQAVPHH